MHACRAVNQKPARGYRCRACPVTEAARDPRTAPVEDNLLDFLAGLAATPASAASAARRDDLVQRRRAPALQRRRRRALPRRRAAARTGEVLGGVRRPRAARSCGGPRRRRRRPRAGAGARPTSACSAPTPPACTSRWTTAGPGRGPGARHRVEGPGPASRCWTRCWWRRSGCRREVAGPLARMRSAGSTPPGCTTCSPSWTASPPAPARCGSPAAPRGSTTSPRSRRRAGAGVAHRGHRRAGRDGPRAGLHRGGAARERPRARRLPAAGLRRGLHGAPAPLGAARARADTPFEQMFEQPGRFGTTVRTPARVGPGSNTSNREAAPWPAARTARQGRAPAR